MNDRREFLKKAALLFAATTVAPLMGVKVDPPAPISDESPFTPRKGVMSRYAEGKVHDLSKPWLPIDLSTFNNPQ